MHLVATFEDGKYRLELYLDLALKIELINRGKRTICIRRDYDVWQWEDDPKRFKSDTSGQHEEITFGISEPMRNQNSDYPEELHYEGSGPVEDAKEVEEIVAALRLLKREIDSPLVYEI